MFSFCVLYVISLSFGWPRSGIHQSTNHGDHGAYNHDDTDDDHDDGGDDGEGDDGGVAGDDDDGDGNGDGRPWSELEGLLPYFPSCFPYNSFTELRCPLVGLDHGPANQ